MLRLTPNRGPTHGNVWIRVDGLHFGGAPNVPIIHIGDAACSEVRYESDRVVHCLLPHGVGTDLNVTVEVGGQTSPASPAAVFNYDGPEVFKVSPSTCRALGGCKLQLVGINFGKHWHPSLHVDVGGLPCMNLTHLSHEQVRCIVAGNVGTDHAVVLRVGGQASQENATLNYEPPEVLDFFPAHAPPAGGEPLVVLGRNFGPRDSMVQAFLGHHACLNCTWVADHRMDCLIPPGTGRGLAVTVVVGEQLSNETSRFDFDRAFNFRGHCVTTRLRLTLAARRSARDQDH